MTHEVYALGEKGKERGDEGIRFITFTILE